MFSWLLVFSSKDATAESSESENGCEDVGIESSSQMNQSISKKTLRNNIRNIELEVREFLSAGAGGSLMVTFHGGVSDQGPDVMWLIAGPSGNQLLGCIKPCKWWDEKPINCCTISAIRMTHYYAFFHSLVLMILLSSQKHSWSSILSAEKDQFRSSTTCHILVTWLKLQAWKHRTADHSELLFWNKYD